MQLKANGWRRDDAVDASQSKISQRARSRDDDQRVRRRRSERTRRFCPRRSKHTRKACARSRATSRVAKAGSRDAWDVKLAVAHAARRSKLWRTQFIRRATNPLKEKSARVSANSFILQARALFSKEALARVRDVVEIPEPAPFSGTQGREPMRVARYRATFDFAHAHRERAQRARGARARAVQDLPARLDGGPAQKRDRQAPVERRFASTRD